ncbi:MAG: hypothetical protein ABI147_06645 [Acidobacteriaceae bacterium]
MKAKPSIMFSGGYMLTVKDAVKSSLIEFAEVFPSDRFQDLRLEEVSIAEDDSTWQVTVSYKNPDFEQELVALREANKNPLAAYAAQLKIERVPTRHLKAITISVDDGSLVSIKNA